MKQSFGKGAQIKQNLNSVKPLDGCNVSTKRVEEHFDSFVGGGWAGFMKL